MGRRRPGRRRVVLWGRWRGTTVQLGLGNADGCKAGGVSQQSDDASRIRRRLPLLPSCRGRRGARSRRRCDGCAGPPPCHVWASTRGALCGGPALCGGRAAAEAGKATVGDEFEGLLCSGSESRSGHVARFAGRCAVPCRCLVLNRPTYYDSDRRHPPSHPAMHPRLCRLKLPRHCSCRPTASWRLPHSAPPD